MIASTSNNSNSTMFRKLVDIWALAELIIAAGIEEQLQDERWVWASFSLIFIVLLALDQSESIAHTQFKLLSLMHAIGVTMAWVISSFGGEPGEFMPFQLNSSWRAEAALLWTGGYVIEWALSLEGFAEVMKFVFPTPPQNPREKGEALRLQFASTKYPSSQKSIASSRKSSNASTAASSSGSRGSSPREGSIASTQSRLSQSGRPSWAVRESIDSDASPTAARIASNSARTLLVGNLPYSTSEATVVTVFEKYGAVESFRLMRERETQASRCFGFLKFKSAPTARSAFAAALEGDIFVRDEVSGRERRAFVEWAKEETVVPELVNKRRDSRSSDASDTSPRTPKIQLQRETIVEETQKDLTEAFPTVITKRPSEIIPEAKIEEKEEKPAERRTLRLAPGSRSDSILDNLKKVSPKILKEREQAAQATAQGRRTLIVGNLGKGVTEADVVEAFLGVGGVESFRLMCDPETNESRCFGFLKFGEASSAQIAYTNIVKGGVAIHDSVSGRARNVKAEWAQAETVVSSKGVLRKEKAEGWDAIKPRTSNDAWRGSGASEGIGSWRSEGRISSN